MPEGGAADIRRTLPPPRGSANRQEKIVEAKNIPLNRYIVRCLQRCRCHGGTNPALMRLGLELDHNKQPVRIWSTDSVGPLLGDFGIHSRTYTLFGLAVDSILCLKPILANRTAPEIAARIVEFSLKQPAFGQTVAKGAPARAATIAAPSVLARPRTMRRPRRTALAVSLKRFQCALPARRIYAFRSASAALRSQSNNAVRSSCVARDGAIGRHL